MILCVFYLILLVIIGLYVGSRLTMGICRNSVCLVGKTAIVTGGNEGIGYQVCLQLASRGCRVIIADIANAENTKNKIIKETNNPNIITKYVNLASFSSVRKFADDINNTEKELHILIHNAGIAGSALISEDGVDTTYQVNFYSQFLLNHLLMDLLKKSAPSRIVATSSGAVFLHNMTTEKLNPTFRHSSFWGGSRHYANSKLCTIIACQELANRVKEHRITVNSLHPGCVRTRTIAKAFENNSIGRSEYFWLYGWNLLTYVAGKDPWEGSQTTLHLAVSKDVEGVTGKHFWDCTPLPILPFKAYDVEFSNQLWEMAEKLTQLEDKYKIK